MNNSEIIEILGHIAELLEVKGENVFKSRSYTNVARAIKFLNEEVADLDAQGRLTEIPGVGEAIAKKLHELVTTGQLEYYNKLKAEFPSGIEEILDIPGVGPHTAAILVKELKIQNVEDLEKAIIDGQVAKLPRLGEKTAQNILSQIQIQKKQSSQSAQVKGL
jgi:DNA polymerase (family X)